MKFDLQKSFGYPVLRTLVQGEGRGELADYPKMNFHPSVSAPSYDLNKDPDHFKVVYELGLTKPKCLLDAIKKKNASIFMHALCKKTFYSKLEKIKELQGEGHVKFEKSLFRGDIDFSIYIIANKDFTLISDEFHEDFGGDSFQIKTGDVLAWSYPARHTAEKKVYQSMKCIFSFSEFDEMEDGTHNLEWDSDYVSIVGNPKHIEKLKRYALDPKGQDTLRASLFVPAIMQLLHLLKYDSSLSEKHDWASVLMAKFNEHEFDLENDSEYQNYAQKLLHMPLKKLISNN